MRIQICVAFIAFVLTGCQTVEPPATASGKPEVVVRAAVPAIKAQLLSMAMDRRFNVTKDTEYLLQIDKPTDNLGAAILLGSKYDSTPAERIVFTFAPMGDTVRVVAGAMFVTNPGSAFERITPVNAGEGVNNVQAMLDNIKRSVELPSSAPPAPVVAPKSRDKLVPKSVKMSAAD